MNSNPNSYNQIDDQNQSEKQIYGSTSFIYKLISDPSRSTGLNETPTLPVSSLGNHIYLQNPNNHQRSSSLLTAQQNPNHGSPTQQLLHQRSKSTLSPTNSVQLPPHAQHARSHSHLTSTPQQASPQMPVSQRSKLSRSSSQLNSQRPNPSMQHRSTSTLAPQHRRDSSNPSRNHPHIQQSPSHPNSTLNILQDILQQSPSNQTIHQRSKSTPYHGFVVWFFKIANQQNKIFVHPLPTSVMHQSTPCRGFVPIVDLQVIGIRSDPSINMLFTTFLPKPGPISRSSVMTWPSQNLNCFLHFSTLV